MNTEAYGKGPLDKIAQWAIDFKIENYSKPEKMSTGPQYKM